MRKFFRNMSIRYKILSPVALLGVLLLALGFTGIWSAGSILDAGREISGNYAVKVEQLGDITAAYQTLRRVAFAHIVAARDSDLQNTLLEESDSLKETIADLSGQYSASLDTAEEQADFEQFETDYAAFLEIYDTILEDSAGGQTVAATALANIDLKEAGDALTEELEQLSAINKADMEAATEHQSDVYSRALIVIIAVLVLGVVVLAYVVWVSWTWACKRLININRQLREVIASIDAGQGDLTKRVQCLCTDEIGTLASGINTFIETLQGIMGQITTSSGQLGTIVSLVSGKVSTANGNSCDISSVMQQLSASMEEISSTLTSIRDNVEVADENIIELSDASHGLNDYAAGMKQRAEELERSAVENRQNTNNVINEIIDKLNEAIESSKSVERVNDLTNEILNISSQTNLLSLNASIEAARAGDAGRGFAVVADEISQLANSSREAANNIQTINNMVIEAVKSLIDGADTIVHYINESILPDYENFVSTGRQYSEDAVHIDGIVTRFRDMSVSLKQLMDSIAQSINGINTAVDESANGTSRVAANTSDLVRDIGEIADAMTDNRQIAGNLSEEAERFARL